MYAEAFRAAAYTPRAHTPTRAAGGTATTTMAGFSEPNSGNENRFASQVRLAESTHRFAANARHSQRVSGVPFGGDPGGGTPFNGRPSTPPRGEFTHGTSHTGGPPSSPMGQSPYMQQRRGSTSSQLSLRSGGSVRGPVSQQRTISRGQLTVLRENAV